MGMVGKPTAPVFQKDEKTGLSLVQPASVLSIFSAVESLVNAVNGGITFGQLEAGSWAGNMNAQAIEHIFPGANVITEIPHGLDRIPVFFFYILDRAGDVYVADLASWGLTSFKLKCSVADAVAKIIVF